MATINVRIDDQIKKDSEKVLNELGFGMTTAINLFLRAVIWHNGIPFSLEIPNKKTMRAIKEVENEISSGKVKGKKYGSVTELRKDLGNWNTILSSKIHVKRI